MSLHHIGATFVGSSTPSLDDVRAGHGVLKKGMTGAAVEYVQAIAGAAVDGNFGPGTEDAVKRFQKEHGLTADGIVGKDSLAAMDKLAGGGTKGVEHIDFSKPDAPAPATPPAAVPPASSVIEKATAVAKSTMEAAKSANNMPLIAGALVLGVGAVGYALLGGKK